MAHRNQHENKLYAGIEAGGTKFNCVIGTSPTNVIARASFPTTKPQETIAKTSNFFIEQSQIHGELASLGLACFGPVDLHKGSATYGYITATPKPHWSNCDVLGQYENALSIPVAFDTDVNGAALGEHLYGAAQDVDDFVYVTIGTGIGGGVFSNGRPLNGLVHPEVGHMLVSLDKEQRSFDSICPFHNNCLTSVAAGPAIKARWKKAGHELPEDHEAWDLEAYYLAIMCMNLTLCFSPARIILGGGVMKQSQLYPKVRQQFKDLMNGYMLPPISLDDYIVAPGLSDQAGEAGALALAEGLITS